jgi:hypothetical protein
MLPCSQQRRELDTLGVSTFMLFAGDPYQIFAYDFMHNWSLGVLQLVIGGIKAYADRMRKPGNGQGYGTRALRRLDERLMQMPRAEGFKLPTTRQYFTKPTNITASEHLAVQQVGEKIIQHSS